tara:strand:- start:619 stop:2493 length:1875 start_codon:yes stop_codon:yes gene_type:complete
MATPLNKLPPGFIVDEPDSGGLPPGFTLDTPAAAPAQTFGEQVMGGAASTADIIAEGALGTAQWLSRPFRRIAGAVTGETEADITASEERMRGTLGAPVGRVTGASEGAAYNQNMMRQALAYVGEHMDEGADSISATTGIPKADVMNMMQSVMAAVPIKVPGVKTTGKVVRNAANMVQDIIDPRAKFYKDVAEGRAPELIAAARRPEAEIIPGARPTFAQATADVGMPRIAAVGEEAKTLPATATKAQALKDAQEAARVKQLKIIERTPETRARAELVRERRSEPLYGEARTAGDVVDVQPTLDYIDGLTETNPGNTRLLSELRELRKGLTRRVEEDVPVLDTAGNYIVNKKTGTVKTKKEVRFEPRTDAQEIASTLDGIKTALKDEKNSYIKKQLLNIQDDLTQAIPSMKEAQAAFKKGSRTLNQRDTATYLLSKLESPIPDAAQRAGSFAGAVREAPRTIKQALEGAPPYETFTEAGLSKTQQRMIDNIVIDLSRDARVKELADAGAQAAPKLKKVGTKMKLPPFISTIVTVINYILERAQGKLTDKMAADIALEFLDAGRAADALEAAMRRTGKRAAIGRAVTAPGRTVAKGYGSIEPGIRAGAVISPNVMAEENRNRMSR